MDRPPGIPPIPTPDDVARVAAMQDLVARNRAVTAGYHAFSSRLRTLLPGEVTWPTLATWASAQAGRTIRKEDLLRALERRLGDSPAVRKLVDGPFRISARYVLESVLGLDPFERSSRAVSRGNLKVYVEIGDAFARYLAVAPVLDSLRPGPPPDGQDFLARAFRAYTRARALPPGPARSQQVLLANLCIGYHEQVRLQPEIEASIDGSVVDGLEIKERLLDRLFPGVADARGSARRGVVGAFLRARAEPLLAPVVVEVQSAVREVLTESLMALELPGETLRLGRDLAGEFPEALRRPENPELREVLALVDPTPDSLRGSGARNWADFRERMHFIADLFRARQHTVALFDPPEDVRLWQASPGDQRGTGPQLRG